MKLINALILFLLIFQFTNLKAEIKPTLLRTVSLFNIVKSPSDVRFNPDGTRIFFADFRSENHLLQFDVHTPFNISSIDFDSKVELFINGTDGFLAPQGFEFNNDGTKVFVINNAGNFQANLLSAPYDFSNPTRVADDGFDFKEDPDPNISNNRAVKFNLDGTKMFLIDVDSNKRVVEFNLSTPFDTSTVTEGNSFAISGTTTILQDFSFDDDGTRMYVIESGTGPGVRFIYVYKLSSGFDITTATFAGKVKQVFEAVGSDGTNGTPLGMGFSEDGMKLYQVTYQNGAVGVRDRVHEYDLICPYGIVLCENDNDAIVSSQIDTAKNVISNNTSHIFKRFDWIKRNDKNRNLNSKNININVHNPILASLTNKIQASLSNNNKKENNSDWSFWTFGDISVGRTGDKASSAPKVVEVGGIMFGADKKLKNNKIVGAALRYGNDNVKIKSTPAHEFDTDSLTLNLYGSLITTQNTNFNMVLGISALSIDQISGEQITGERNGKQIFAGLNLLTNKKVLNSNFSPTAKFEFGITELSKYTDFGRDENFGDDIYDDLTFETGNISAGLKYSNISKYNNNINGGIEYVNDFTPNIDYKFKNTVDNVSVTKTVSRHSTHNVKGSLGFEKIYNDSFTFSFNLERFQGLSDSSHQDSLYLKLSKIRDDSGEYSLNLNPLEDGLAKINYKKTMDYFNLELNSDYELMSEVPAYNFNILVSNTF